LLAKSSSLNGAEWKLPPVAQWCEPGESEHLVQFYESDTFLLNSLNSFVGNGLAAGDTCVVVANKTHRHSLEAGLQASGLDLDLVRSSGQYVALDSSETLAKFMVNGLLERERFREIVGGLITQASGRGRVRVFGDMVAQLSAANQHRAAVVTWKHSGMIYKPLIPLPSIALIRCMSSALKRSERRSMMSVRSTRA